MTLSVKLLNVILRKFLHAISYVNMGNGMKIEFMGQEKDFLFFSTVKCKLYASILLDVIGNLISSYTWTFLEQASVGHLCFIVMF